MFICSKHSFIMGIYAKGLSVWVAYSKAENLPRIIIVSHSNYYSYRCTERVTFWNKGYNLGDCVFEGPGVTVWIVGNLSSFVSGIAVWIAECLHLSFSPVTGWIAGTLRSVLSPGRTSTYHYNYRGKKVVKCICIRELCFYWKQKT